MSVWMKRVAAWIIAVAITAGLGSCFSTQRVLTALPDPQGQIGLSARISTALYDLQHFGTLYAVFILIAFLIAFLVAALVYRIAGVGRAIVFSTAGAAAMLIMLIAMKQAFFGVDIVAGARDSLGLLMQMLAGAIGGYVYHRMSRTGISKS